MVTRLKVSDVPKPWFTSKEQKGKISKQNPIQTEDNAFDDSAADYVLEESSKRGRGRSKGKAKVGHAKKWKAKGKALSASAVDVVLGCSKNLVPDAEELRRKRAKDSVACGRHVRTVLKTPQFNIRPTSVTSNSIHGDMNMGVAIEEVPLAIRFSPPKSSCKKTKIDNRNKVEDSAMGFLDKIKETAKPSFVRRPGKEPVVDDVQQLVRARRSERKHDDTDSDVGSEDRGHKFRDSLQRQSPLASKDLYNESCRGREPQRHFSREVECTPQRRQGYDRSSRSPGKNVSQSSREHELRSPRRSMSKSPRAWTEGHQQKSVNRLTQNDKRYAYNDRSNLACRDSRMERPHIERYASSSPERGVRHRRSPSLEYNQRLSKRSTTPYSSSSPPRMSRDGNDSRGTKWRSAAVLERGEKVQTLPAMGRKERRHSQLFREAKMDRRQRNGQKAFYLTLDPEGRPYGPGRPAWIAKINKLATYLDPSCTHIRKQTFEDVQTLKGRLNETFEYSGTLNQDHLRGLMGKAVTKKRAELILLIKNKGEQPKHLDYQVWRRLKKLAKSKQCEDKSEQGRYANACRKTLGRTGSTGENGIREKLRTLLGRSPDPHEVEEEMQRDKGFGGQKRKISTLVAKFEKQSKEVMFTGRDSSRDSHSEEVDLNSEGYSSEADGSVQYKRHARNVPKIGGQGSDLFLVEMDVSKERVGHARKNYTVAEEETISKDDYIEELKAEIQRLQAKDGKGTTSNTVMPSQSPMSMPYSSRKGMKFGSL